MDRVRVSASSLLWYSLRRIAHWSCFLAFLGLRRWSRQRLVLTRAARTWGLVFVNLWKRSSDKRSTFQRSSISCLWSLLGCCTLSPLALTLRAAKRLKQIIGLRRSWLMIESAEVGSICRRVILGDQWIVGAAMLLESWRSLPYLLLEFLDFAAWSWYRHLAFLIIISV